jgi:hypothetical protein
MKNVNIIAQILYNKTRRILFWYYALLCICLNSLWMALFNEQWHFILFSFWSLNFIYF